MEADPVVTQTMNAGMEKSIDAEYSEAVVIVNGCGLSKVANIQAWRDWAGSLPVRILSTGLDDIVALQDVSHIWVADANFVPIPSAFRSEMRKKMPPRSAYVMFSTGKPVTSRYSYDEKWTSTDDKHDKFGGLRFLKTSGLDKPYEVDQTYDGDHVDFVNYQATRLGFPYCVFQLASNEPSVVVDSNFSTVQDIYANALKMSLPSTSILESHKELASRSDTEMFVVFDADFQLETELLGTEGIKPWDTDAVHLWYARNPVNGLEYGHGGPKAFNCGAFLNLDDTTIDVTTNASSARLILHKEVVGVHAFNWSALATWRTAFREAAKLALSLNTTPDEEQYKEAFYRLDTWCTKADPSAAFGGLCLDGAKIGRRWAERARTREQVLLINNFQWLREQFEQRHGTTK
jgi:hypothetical protein